MDCAQKYNILDTLVAGYLPGMTPQCLMEFQKPPPSPHLGRPRAEGSCSMGGYQRSRGVFWAMTQGPTLHVNPEIVTKNYNQAGQAMHKEAFDVLTASIWS